jgi:hypothetical protein
MPAAFTRAMFSATSFATSASNACGAIGSGSMPDLRQPLVHARRSQHLLHRLVQPVDDLARGLRRHEHADPERVVGIGVAGLDRGCASVWLPCLRE